MTIVNCSISTLNYQTKRGWEIESLPIQLSPPNVLSNPLHCSCDKAAVR